MHWFLAKIVYRIICGSGEHTAQFDEQWLRENRLGWAELMDTIDGKDKVKAGDAKGKGRQTK